MYKFICISMESRTTVEHSQRKQYFRSIMGNYLEKKKGMINKFNNAYGFKDVVDDFVSEYPTVIPARISSPKDYVSPELLLYKSFQSNLTEKGICKFVIPFGKMEHPNSRFSYSNKNIAKNFFEFLQKVYPQLIITYSLLEDYCRALKEKILDHFYQDLSDKDIHYTVECSASHLLQENELEEILKILRAMCPMKFHIEQHFCETCRGYNPESPYHIEIEYDA